MWTAFLPRSAAIASFTLDLTILPDAEIDAVFEINEPSCSYLQDGSLGIQSVINGVEPFTIYVDGELNSNGGSLAGFTRR